MNLRKVLLFSASALMASFTAQASHISGGEILYECLGSNQYEITMNLFRDCAGIDMNPSETITFTSPCGTAQLTVNLVQTIEVSQLCPEEIVNSTCSGGFLPGMQMYTYTGTVTLPPCDTWSMDWELCCRNAAILNLVTPDGLTTHLTATLNSNSFPCDNSPVFNNVPIPYVCLNQPITYSFGVSEGDGDSLHYELVTAMDIGGAPVPYAAGYTAVEPIPGITIDPNSGLLQFTPTLEGNFVVAVQVTQYDSEGNVIGTVMRDIQFVVIPCTNEAPDPSTGVATNFSGTATLTGNYSVEMCETDDFCFDFTIVDPDAIDTLNLISNISLVLPGATFTWGGANPVTGTICWTAPVGSAGFHSFFINASDDACPVNAFQTYVYTVNVLTRTSAGPDWTLCGDQVATLDGNGGANFTWSVLSGDPIVLGVNFSCNPCEDPIADPATTTTYVVQSDLSGACINSDTVTVFVVPDFSYTVTQADTTLCLGATVDFTVTVSPPGSGYGYEWEPATGLSCDDCPNPVGTYSLPGTYEYTVTMTSPDECVHLDTTISVTVNPAFAPDFTVTPQDEYICIGDSTVFLVELDNTVPSYCGLNFAGCSSGVITQTDIGDATTAGDDFTYPAVFGNFYTGNRNQFLFTAAELQAMGFVGGTISEIGFNVESIPAGAYTDYYNFEIKMGCTTQEQLQTGIWIDGLSVVFPADTVTATTGWNQFTFAAGFNWDGVSNLVVEVCTDRYPNFGTDWTNNLPNYYTTTSFTSVHEWHSDLGDVCTDAPGGFMIESVSPNRPNTRFQYCAGINEDMVSYTWSPTDGLSCVDCPDPVVTPITSPAVYTVQVGDDEYGCYTEQTVTVNWYPPAEVSFIPEPNTGVAPFTVFLNNTSASNVGNFVWYFGDGNDSAGVYEPYYTYTSPGMYYVTLTGIDANGCFGTYTDSIEVLDKPIVEIPNVFSPNGDGENDAFSFIDLRGFRDFSLKIFNRWGMTIHETSNVNSTLAAWKPTDETPDGTYYYEFVGTGYNGEGVTKTGHITLVR